MSLGLRRLVVIAGLVAVTVLVAAGCGRRVVIDPDDVQRHNTEWIQRRPSTPPANRLTPASAPPPAGADAGTPPRTI